jgi:hypothetical protein
MPAGYQALMPLLGAAIGQSAPTRNKDIKYIDQDGNYIDWEGNVLGAGTRPYEDAGFGTRWLHPEVAAQIGALNNQQFDALRANAVKNQVNATNAGIVRPVMGLPLNDPRVSNNQFGLLTGGNSEATNLSGQESAQSDIAGNIPKIATASKAANLKESGQKAQANIDLFNPQGEAVALANKK